MAIYKPPNFKWPNPPLLTLEHQGDFNCRHAEWGYFSNDENGEILSNWIVNNDLHLAFDAKGLRIFRSARWPSETNPDLCIVTTDNSQVTLHYTKKVLSYFPNIQHRPVLFKVGLQIILVRPI